MPYWEKKKKTTNTTQANRLHTVEFRSIQLRRKTLTTSVDSMIAIPKTFTILTIEITTVLFNCPT